MEQKEKEIDIQTELLKYWEKSVDKFSSEAKRIGSSIPYIPMNGKYEDMGEKDISWWTNGFWPGILWLMYNATGDILFREPAEKIEKRLDQSFLDFNGIHHDVGFVWGLSAIANYRITGNKTSLTRGLHAATILAGRYNPRGKFIRSWNDDKTGWIIVDSLMNLPILHWASSVTGDPRFSYIADDHAQTVLRTIVRDDGSCNHIAILDPTNGNVLKLPKGQGYGEGSSWSRGQAWGIYGFALSYKYTKNQEYKEISQKIAAYFISNIEQTDYIPALDFRAPDIPKFVDTSAAVCAASGLLELSQFSEGKDKSRYLDVAWKIIQKISENYCNWTPEKDSLVSHGSVAYHNQEIHVPIIYSDFFYLESILKMIDNCISLW
jgi:unsaturated chondroitin disaccharide hydrolase